MLIHPDLSAAKAVPPAELRDYEGIQTLIVDDNSFDRRRLARECAKLEAPITVDEAPSLSVLRQRLDEKTYDLVIVDYRLNDGDGLQALEIVRAHPTHVDCATIMVAGVPRTDVAVGALKNGCCDYLSKTEITAPILERAILAAMRQSHLQREASVASGLNDALTRVLGQFSRNCTDEMKPLLSHILRGIRSGRSGPGDERSRTMLAEFEADCMKLWEIVEKLESYTEQVGEKLQTSENIFRLN